MDYFIWVLMYLVGFLGGMAYSLAKLVG